MPEERWAARDERGMWELVQPSEPAVRRQFVLVELERTESFERQLERVRWPKSGLGTWGLGVFEVREGR